MTKTLASDIKESYIQDEHCRLLIDHFGGRKITLPSHLKADLNRFSYSDGLLWHQLSPWDPLTICFPHDTDLKQKILYELHDIPSSGHLGRKRHSYECQMIFVATPISVNSQLYSIMRRVSERKACTF